jgi:hypothetical protein
MSRQFAPTPTSVGAIALYNARSYSYGSYFEQYCRIYGRVLPGEGDVVRERIKQGIGNGVFGNWQPDVSAPYGAVRLYHLWTTGANPRLATMYEPIIRQLIAPW